MGNPFTSAAIANYNANPPADDGTAVSANQIKWSTIKTKLDDPIKTLAEADVTNTNAAFAKIIGGGGFTTTAIDYTVLSTDQGKFVKVTASGKIITSPDATVVGSPFVFVVVNESSGDITFSGNNPGVQQTVDGANSITIPAGAGLLVNTDGTNWFTGGQNFTKTNIVPQGRLTLVTGTAVMSSDQTGKTSVFYTPYNGDQIPIPNGTTFSLKEFSELTLTLAANHSADTIYDIFVFLDPADNSTIRIGTGPAWSNSTAGSCARGTGAGTTELALLKGFFVNNVSATMRNGATTYSVGAKSAIFVGSIWIDHTAGQVSAHVTTGQNRKVGIANAFNRREASLKVTDGTASWAYSTNTIRAANNVPASWASTTYNVGSGTTANGLTVFSCLAEEWARITITGQAQNSGAGTSMQVGIGINSTTAITGTGGKMTNGPTNLTPETMNGKYSLAPTLGITTVQALETAGGATGTFFGTELNMLLQADWLV